MHRDKNEIESKSNVGRKSTVARVKVRNFKRIVIKSVYSIVNRRANKQIVKNT